MSKFDFLPTARLEYGEAVDWYLGKSVHVAYRFVTEVENAIDEIRRSPERFARWDDTYCYHQLQRFPSFVAYRQTADSVVIVAIRHAAQDQEAWLGR